MSTTRANRARTAQAKIAAQRAAAQRRRRIMLATASISAVIAVFSGMVIAKAAAGPNHPAAQSTSSGPAAAVTAQVLAAVTTVPAATLDSVGAGSVTNPPHAISGAPSLTAGGKPEIVYLGYEWCPFCAAERWAITVALSRFGSFTGLGLVQSASDDVYPSTHTITYAGASYSSQYLAFTPVEMQDANRNPLQTPTEAEQQLISVYDAPPYVSSASSGGLPFLDLGGKYVVSGASFDPQTLAGQTWSQIAAALSAPSSADAQAIDGSANAITAALCTLTGDKPTAVCTSPAVAKAKGTLR